MRLTALLLILASTAHAGLGLFPRTGVSMKAMKFDPSFPKDLRAGCTFNAPLTSNLIAEGRGDTTPEYTGGVVSGAGAVYYAADSAGVMTAMPSGGALFPNFAYQACGVMANLCLWSCNLAVSPSWVSANCTTAFTSTGPDAVAGTATRITATDADATVLQDITSTAGVRITSCWIKRITGTGTISLTNWGSTTWEAVTVTTDWTRVNTKASDAGSVNPTVGIQITTSGDAVDVWGFAHDKLAFVAPGVIVTQGAAGARTTDGLTYPDSGNCKSAPRITIAFTGAYNSVGARAIQTRVVNNGFFVATNGFSLTSGYSPLFFDASGVSGTISSFQTIIAGTSHNYRFSASGAVYHGIMDGAVYAESGTGRDYINGTLGKLSVDNGYAPIFSPYGTINRVAFYSVGLSIFDMARLR